MRGMGYDGTADLVVVEPLDSGVQIVLLDLGGLAGVVLVVACIESPNHTNRID